MGKGRWEHLQIADVYLIHADGSGLKRLTEHRLLRRPGMVGVSDACPYCMSGERFRIEFHRKQ